ncbi:unnamed protein product [Acanthoscelides obtectus]|uniref:Uncharacterized protein n=1 Tax=Acanthoscelides obtectus TaxID=200917 RepID=A0A9P0VP45_ACAOB|nr:unnamed protein product [Acanthoscelides obtectus]CAK1630945.1 hypothetical protein AOBTE_LOCUS6664 [Acanthoscelides obtectus]
MTDSLYPSVSKYRVLQEDPKCTGKLGRIESHKRVQILSLPSIVITKYIQLSHRFPGIIGIHGTMTLKNLENNLGKLDASDGEKFESLISDLQNDQNKLSEAINSQTTLSVELIDNSINRKSDYS